MKKTKKVQCPYCKSDHSVETTILVYTCEECSRKVRALPALAADTKSGKKKKRA